MLWIASKIYLILFVLDEMKKIGLKLVYSVVNLMQAVTESILDKKGK